MEWYYVNKMGGGKVFTSAEPYSRPQEVHFRAPVDLESFQHFPSIRESAGTGCQTDVSIWDVRELEHFLEYATFMLILSVLSVEHCGRSLTN